MHALLCVCMAVRIEYLDGEDFKQQLNAVDINMDAAKQEQPDITLLFRPGHYDILYSNS